MEIKKTPLELAQEHWTWLQSILDKQREMERKIAIDFFVHGYKHGHEDKSGGFQLKGPVKSYGEAQQG